MARIQALEPLKQTFHDLYLTDCQCIDGALQPFVEPRLQLDYTLCYVLSGSGCITINEEVFELHAGQGLLISPNERCYSSSSTEAPWNCLSVSFSGTRADTYLTICRLSQEDRRFLSTHSSQLADLVHRMHYLHASGSDALLLQGLLFQFLSYLAEDAALPFTYEQLKNPYILKTVRYIQDHYAENLQISQLADRLEVNRCYLAALFKRELQLSPHSFLMQYRMGKAEQLLKNTALSITEISIFCGYGDPDSFGKAFKKVTGTQPTSFRKDLS